MTKIAADKDQISKLKDLQVIDSDIFDLKTQLEYFPEKIKTMDESLELKKVGMKSAEDFLTALKVRKNEKEVEMKTFEEKIAKYEGDLNQIKNNNQYQALKKEIDGIKADVSIIEETIINMFDEIESAAKVLEDEKSKFETERVINEKEISEIKLQEKVLADKIKDLESGKDKIVSQIRPEILDFYNRVLKNKGRIALADVQNDCCGECNIQLRPQIVNDAKLKKNIVMCENCSRILCAED